MKHLRALIVALFIVVGWTTQAQSPDEQYVGIFTTIQQADALLASGDAHTAVARYLDAQAALRKLRTVYPNWNPKVVQFRLDYVAGKVAGVTVKPSAVTNLEAGTTKPAPEAKPAEPNPELVNELKALREQVGQLQADKNLLEAKLKEALTAQPAAIDPRELVKAEERIRSLEKEADLLKVSLEQERAKKPAVADSAALERLKQELAATKRQLSEQANAAKALAQERTALQRQLDQKPAADKTELAKAQERVAALERETESLKSALEQERANKPGVDTATLDRLRQDLAEANRKAGEQSELAKSLAQEKAEIQKRLDALPTTSTPNAELAQTKQALTEANRRLAEQTEVNQKLVQEREALQAKVKSLGVDAEALAALRAENELLKKQAAEAKPTGGKSAIEPELQQARARIAALQSDLELLRTEKTALENRVKTLSTVSATATAASPADVERLAQLQKERDELQLKLDGAMRDLVRGKTETATSRAQETANQLAALRARIEVLEARPIPYSAEELALMKAPAPRLATAAAVAPSKTASSAQTDISSVTLVAEAQRQFAARQYDKAEESYLQVLRKDDRNVVTLANLAVTQMQLGKLDEAEARARQAVMVAPNDAYSHSVLGQVKMRQEKYDEAVDALSRAAQLDSKSAEVQNFLGIALSHKGLRLPAETALRKAIMLEPGYGSAHNNLAVIYLNQNPPMVELARWHYKKALAAGSSKNPELEKALEEKGASAAKP